jgi:predicted nucleotidyltransferase
MSPLALRHLVGAFVSGELDRDGFRRGIEEAVRGLSRGSGRAVALVRGVAFAVQRGAARSEEAARDDTGERVLTGLCHELLEALPATDSAPARDEILGAITNRGRTLARRSGLELIGLAGSVARGSASAFSDVDVAARWIEQPSGWRQFGALETCRRELARLLDRPVDLAVISDLKPLVRESFLRDMIPLDDPAHAA